MLSWSKRLALLQPFSSLDFGLSGAFLGVIITIWYVGDFHTFHHGDTAIFTLNSLYRWTAFAWEYDHIGSLLPLLVSFIRRPYWNLIALTTLNAFAFLGGLALWGNLLARRRLTLAESSLWISLIVPLVMPRHKIFNNAAHNFPWGLGLFFAALFTFCLLHYLKVKHWRAVTLYALGLFSFAFLAVYVSSISLIPLFIITPAVIWQNSRSTITFALFSKEHSDDNVWPIKVNSNFAAFHLAPVACLLLALLAYQALEQSAEFRTRLTLDIANIPLVLPPLLWNWIDKELTTPLVLVAAIPALLFALCARQEKSLIAYFAAGVLAETLVVSSSFRTVYAQYPSIYLTELTFLIMLSLAISLAGLIGRVGSSIARQSMFTAAIPLTLFLNALTWRSFSPVNPFTALDHAIGANTLPIVEAECDLLIGDYWKVWPALLAANDYYYRQNIIDSRTGQTRMLVGVAYRAWPIESLWRSRFNWPEAKLCSFANDDEGVARAIHIYAPDIALLMTRKTQVGPIVVSQLENRRLPSLGFEFDNIASGPGWHGQEVTPDGQTFQWMKESAVLILPLATDHNLTLRFRVRPALAPDILPSLMLAVNGHPVALAGQPEANGDTTFEAVIPKALLDNPRYTQLVFRVSRTVIPDDLYGNGDTRALGLAFDWLRVDPAITTARP